MVLSHRQPYIWLSWRADSCNSATLLAALKIAQLQVADNPRAVLDDAINLSLQAAWVVHKAVAAVKLVDLLIPYRTSDCTDRRTYSPEAPSEERALWTWR